MREDKVLREDNILKEFIKYVSLNIMGMIGLSCYILADTFFVANKLGADGLAALNLAISVYSVIHAAGLMLGIGGGSRYTVWRAQGKNREAEIVFTHTVILGLAAGLVLLILGVLAAWPLARLLGADGDTLGMTGVYLRVILCFAPCFLLNNILLSFVRNDGNPKLAMAAMLTGSFSNIILDYLLIFPLGLGMFGAALATGAAPLISMGVLSRHIRDRRRALTGEKPEGAGTVEDHRWAGNGLRLVRCGFHLRETGSILSLGLSSFVTEASSGIVLMVFNLVILGLAGNVGVAAYGIVANFALVAAAVFTGIAQGIQPVVSRGYGKGDRRTLRRILWYGSALSLLLAAVIYLGIYLGAEQISMLFNSEGNAALTAMAVEGFRLYFAGFFFAGVNIVTAAYLSAAGRPGAAFAIALTRGCLAILPLVWILSAALGMPGVWLSFVGAELLALSIAVGSRPWNVLK